MNTLLLWMLTNTLWAFAIGIILWASTKCFKLSPTIRHLLWLVVLLKLLVPPVVHLALPEMTAEPIAAFTESAATLPERILPETGPLSRVRYFMPMETDAAVNATPAPKAASIDLYAWGMTSLFLIWLTGAVIMAFHQLQRGWFLHRSGRHTDPAPAWLQECLHDTAQRLGMRTPKLLMSATAGSVYTYGLLRPRIIVAQPLLEQVERERWEAILTHELAHLKRKDHWIGWLEMIGLCLHWWNPVFHITRKYLREQAELACDAWVLWALPEARRTYAETLINVTENLTRAKAPAYALGMSAQKRRIFKRRLTMILNGNPKRHASIFTLACIALFTCALLPAWSAPKPAENMIVVNEGNTTIASTPAPAPTNMTITEKVAQITPGISTRDDVINVFGPPKEKPNENYFAYPDGLGFYFRGKIVHETRFERPGGTGYRFRDALEIGSPLEDVLKIVGEPTEIVTGKNEWKDDVLYMDIDGKKGWGYYCCPDQKIRFFFMDNKVIALYLTAVKTSNDTVIQETLDKVVKAIQATPAPPRYTPEEQAKIQEMHNVLSSEVSIEFENIHLQDIATYLSNAYDINIALDYQAIHSKYTKPPFMIDNPRFMEVPLYNVLQTLAESGAYSMMKYSDHKEGENHTLFTVDDNGFRAVTTFRGPNETLSSPITFTEGFPSDKIPLTKVLEAMAEQANVRFAWMPPGDKKRMFYIGKAERPKATFEFKSPESFMRMYNKESLVSDGYVNYVTLKNLSLYDALQAIAHSLDLAVSIEPGVVWITSHERVEEPFGPAVIPVESESALKLQKQLRSDASLQFESIHLSDICDYISQMHDVNFMLDSRVIPTKGEFKSDSKTDGYIHYLLIKNCSLKTSLQIMLRALDLDFAIMNNYIWISDREKIASGDLPKSLPNSF